MLSLDTVRNKLGSMVGEVRTALKPFGVAVDLRWEPDPGWMNQYPRAVVTFRLRVQDWGGKTVTFEHCVGVREMITSRNLDGHLKYLKDSMAEDTLFKMYRCVWDGPPLPPAPEQDWRPESFMPEDHMV